ncbi:Putative cytochrome P450, hem peroxidase superfamily, hem peroxidase, animal-type [Colletotrichum destructivum]|uniref:linoleate 8R-lipoxygenase n=1 Tax=Colletotrichum destructivum TaxID=34406 RepID=A0AAX4I6S7_9PEZI|nr:Putative cytochrome P450, hem peroxidase superfamily, hem peroxidase, animal-type [Colletotrichum destructivum]
MSFDQKFMAGDTYGDERKSSANFFSDPTKVAADILKDYVGLRSQTTPAELVGLIKELLQKGEPLDDKKGTTEVLIGILTSLPATSEARVQLTNKLIDTLWGNLQHPPLSYVGGDVKFDVVNSQESGAKDKPKAEDSIEFKAPDSDIILREQVPQAPDGLHHYRMPDGSFNNILEPNLGKAGTPYAKTVRSVKALHGVKPDPGLLFDLLMARDDNSFKENPAGISSMLFYHASIIIHDIFRTNRTDMNKSDTSSYLDLAPLYGSSLKDQLEIRTMKEGRLKPDTFHEKRLLGQPAGVNVMLVLYSRFHNYVCDILLKINENDRFTLQCPADAGPEDRAKAVAKQDHDLFNTARLIVGGLYINICLHDYLRAITNTHHSKSDWTLDPRVEIGKQFDGDGVPRGVGYQVSVEFNLLYRFHSCISKKDERWIDGFFAKLFPDRKPEDLQNVGMAELGRALVTFEQSIPKDPSVRTFDNLERQPDGTFRDEDLARILKEAMDDPAGCFGARMVPKALKVVEILGINQARKWQVANLNQFRSFFGLKKYDKFSEINSNPEIASLLEKLYTDPDMVELYPGLMIEDIKPARNTGSGICPTYSVGRAVLSDAVTLVRSDRFNTIDYTVSNLTAWGFNEVQQDYKTLGGSMLYKLIQRGLPNWFPYNSIAVMQPMYTRKANQAIAKELGTLHLYTSDDPKPPPKPVVLMTGAAIKHVLGNPKQFVVPWLQPLNALFTESKKDISWFMLAGDDPKNVQHRVNITKALGKVPNLHNAVHDFVERVGAKLIEKETFKLREGLCQMDLIRDVAIPLNAQLLADLFYFDMRTDENPNGTLGAADLYRHLLNIRVWGVNNNDPAQAWNRRRRARESVKVMIDSTRTLVSEVAVGRGLGFGIVSTISNVVGRKSNFKKDSLRSCGYKLAEELLAQGNSVDQVVDNMWLTAFGGIGVPFYEVMEFFLRRENASIWAEVQTLAQAKDDGGLHAYVREAQRLTSSQRNVRVATAPAEVEGKSIQPGNLVVMLLGEAGRNPKEVADAAKFDPQRKVDAVTAFSYGQHECVAKDIATTFIVGLVKLVADLKQLRPAPGQMGLVKTIRVGSEKAYLNDSWSYLGFDASTWKVHFDGHGKGSFQGDAQPNKPIDLGQYYYLLQKRKDDLFKGADGSS